MKKEKVAIKVYFDKDDETYRKIEKLSADSSLSTSAISRMALQYGISHTSQALAKVMPKTKKLVKKKPK